MSEGIHLGHQHVLRWTEWDPDVELNPQYAELPELEPGQHFGAIIGHRKPDGDWCEGVIIFDTPRARRFDHNRPRWQVHSWDPLTITPSVLCSCGDHGFITDGRWVVA
jgi:hypothetical protein